LFFSRISFTFGVYNSVSLNSFPSSDFARG
jgi:hypothetical protein